MVKVLHKLANLDGGGVGRILYDYYSMIDHNKVHFDFLISTDIDNGILEQPLKDMGSKIYKIPSYQKDKNEYYKQAEKYINSDNYDVIHIHRVSGSEMKILKIAEKAGIPDRIVHAHSAFRDDSFIKKQKRKAFAVSLKRNATQLAACGSAAAAAVWGKKALDSGEVKIVRNAINVEKFSFDDNLRRKLREELDITSKTAIVTVGRLSEEKNQEFALKTFAELTVLDDNAIFIVIGRGNEEEKLKKLCVDLKITDKVRFLGICEDVPRLLNAMDIFMLPSIYEGFPVSLVEAQANGLKCFVSDNVTREACITDLAEYIPINGTEKLWAEKIASKSDFGYERSKYSAEVLEAGYDIKSEAVKLQNFYMDCVKNRSKRI
jgi:glycosyltransferase involved in cell wall biosynthesis